MTFCRLTLACLACGLLAAETGETTVAVYGTRLIVSAPTYRSSPEILRRLGQKVTVDFEDTTFADAVEFLRANCGINMIIGNDIRIAAPVVSLKLKDVPLATVLKWMTVTTKVRFHVMDQAVFFTNDPITGDQVVKIYDVADVVHAVPHFRGPQVNLDAGGVDIGGVGEEVDESPYTAEDLAEIVRKQLAVE